MAIFACRRCGHYVTAEVREEPLPPPAEAAPGGGTLLPPRMSRGSYASGEELGGLLLNPGDITGVRPHPDPGRRNGCCGLAGLDGPNLVCAQCGAEVATQQSDCWTEQRIVLLPDAVQFAGQG